MGDQGASISDCGLYRYRLWRSWGGGPRMAFVMLNPSTADAAADDPTIRRCIGFAKREGYEGIEVLNLYALRATKPKHLLDHPHPEGGENSIYWNYVLNGPLVGAVVAAWGAHAGNPKLAGSQAFEIVSLRDWQCLGTTADGSPRHPLYVRGDQPLVPLIPTRQQESRDVRRRSLAGGSPTLVDGPVGAVSP